MLIFQIHFKTINDFRKYAAFEGMFRMRGYVIIRGERTDMYDLLDLMSQGPVRQAKLVLTQYEQTDVERIGGYLRASGLLNESDASEDSVNRQFPA